MNGELFTKAIDSVTDDWRKQRKKEERGRPEVKERRRRVMSCCEYEYSTRVTITDAANECMEAAYMKASAGGTLPTAARQIMYAARPTILANACDRHGNPMELRSEYFTQTLLPTYMREHDCEDWDVVFDARGHFTEPHTKKTVPLGTLDVRNYLRNINVPGGISREEVDDKYPTCGPVNRYSAVLFIEKEGFLPLFNAVNLARRYDIAIMSTKGMSVTAARTLVENVCGNHNVPLLILRDFDKAGFTIAATLRRDTKRFQFSKSFTCVDLGLRLDDVKKWGLSSEEVFYKSSPRKDLKKNGATPEEIDFLYEGGGGNSKRHYGQRVELNAFSSDDFIKWIEFKLAEQGVKKVVPDADTLREAYARAVKVAVINKAIEDAMDDADEAAENHPVPKTLVRQIRKQLEEKPELAWDTVVAEAARCTVVAEADE